MSEAPVRIAVVGMGKIARDQHLPAIADNIGFALAATADPSASGVDTVPHFASLETMLVQGPQIDAVALCTPPQFRHALAAQALDAGLHVLLEKPPCASLAEAEDLVARARAQRTTLFAAWHSRFAAAVAPAKEWLSDKKVTGVSITWREDVRMWHPGQAWIWQPGGLGVFDPGINALSIATAILPQTLLVESATLEVPANRSAPIAARLRLRDAAGAPGEADFDWRQTGPQTWDIRVDTDGGALILAQGGAQLTLGDGEARLFADREYPALYEHFAQLVRGGASDADLAPFRLVADAFLLGTHEAADEFFD